jgi:nucleotide-binding universal stress UspA family protein
MLKLLIAVDGSAHAGHAIEAVAKLAKRMPELDVVLFNVRELPVYYGELPAFDFEAIEEAAKSHQTELLGEAVAHARTCGLQQVSAHAAVGLPSDEILRAADELKVDQIVIGTHGRNALAGLVMGSVAQRVVHGANVPVLLVK